MTGIFRITWKAHAPQDPSGGFYSEGRWHPKGFPVLYFCASLPMCVLELRANGVSFDTMRSGYHFTRCDVDIPISLETVPGNFYGVDWVGKKAASQEYGGDWLRSKNSLLLSVKSAVLPTETNYLMNPAHSGFPSIFFPLPDSIPLDPRIA